MNNLVLEIYKCQDQVNWTNLIQVRTANTAGSAGGRGLGYEEWRWSDFNEGIKKKKKKVNQL